jgi:hypothetical protein
MALGVTTERIQIVKALSANPVASRYHLLQVWHSHLRLRACVRPLVVPMLSCTQQYGPRSLYAGIESSLIVAVSCPQYLLCILIKLRTVQELHWSQITNCVLGA